MYVRDERLGAVPVAAAAAATKIAFPNLFKKDKNPARLAANAKAFADGMRNPNAIFVAPDGKNTGLTSLQFLLLKSPLSKGGGGGWATDKTEEDAFVKYTALKAHVANLTQSGGTVPQMPGSVPSILTGSGGGINVAGMSVSPALLASLGFLALAFILRDRR